MGPTLGNVTQKSTAGDEDLFPAVVGKRLAGKAGVERVHLESGDVEEPEPLVLGGPPEGDRRAIVADNVDPIIARCVPDVVRYKHLLVLTVEARGEPVVEGKGIPGEPPFRPQLDRDALEGAAAVGPDG